MNSEKRYAERAVAEMADESNLAAYDEQNNTLLLIDTETYQPHTFSPGYSSKRPYLTGQFTDAALVESAPDLSIFSAVDEVIYTNRPQVLATRKNADGSSKVVIAEPHLFGFMGIEIVVEDRAADGSTRYASVQDLLSNWEDVYSKYQTHDGGGLLAPRDAGVMQNQ